MTLLVYLLYDQKGDRKDFQYVFDMWDFKEEKKKDWKKKEKKKKKKAWLFK